MGFLKDIGKAVSKFSDDVTDGMAGRRPSEAEQKRRDKIREDWANGKISKDEANRRLRQPE